MKRSSSYVFSLLLSASTLWAFVPPLAAVLKANFDGRKPGAYEMAFRHQILLKNGETLSVEERFVKLNGKVHVIFKSPIYGEFGAVWGKTGYQFGLDKKVPSRSQAFMIYFTTHQADVFREVLIEEKLAKRDQFLQYKSSFAPEGDPAHWDLNENYLAQPDLSFARTPVGPSITAIGLEDGTSRRAVFFEKNSLLLSRLEWKKDQEVTAWNFGQSQKLPGGGSFPKELFFQVDGREIIKSQLISRVLLEEKGKKQWLSRFSSVSRSPLNASLEDALRILLGYR